MAGPMGTLTVIITPAPGETWRHYKGGVYKIITIAEDEGTRTAVVVYTGESGTWTRPVQDFVGQVATSTYQGPRFTLVSPPEIELHALRRVVRGFVTGRIGRKDRDDWWGACGFIHGKPLPEVLLQLAEGAESPSDHLSELSAVQAAINETQDDD